MDNFRYGGEVITCDYPSIDDREKLAEQIAKERGMMFLSSCENRDVICGHGTVAMEMLEQVYFLSMSVNICPFVHI